MPFSVLILTLNEEANLARCLKALENCDDIVVLDSFSTDRTEQISSDYGVRFQRRRFDDCALQRNYGINRVEYKYPWLLMVGLLRRLVLCGLP
jgi:glycosyltransferase involved in cell wall biosynthesis